MDNKQELSEQEAIATLITSPAWKFVEQKILDYFRQARENIDESLPLQEIGAMTIAIKRFSNMFEKFLRENKFMASASSEVDLDRYR
jgi:hypothetical protein